MSEEPGGQLAQAVKLVLESVLDAVVVIDREGTIVAWNTPATQTFGWTASEAIGQPMVDLIIPPRHREAHSRGLRHYQQSGEARVLNRRIEIEASDKSGREFPIELAIATAPAIGRAAFVGFLRDISERRAAGDRLALSEESLRLATEAAEIGTWDLDLTTDTLTWSDRTRAMFGISPGQPCDMRDFYTGLHPEDREGTTAAFAAALDPAIRATYDVQYRTIGKEDGLIRWVAAKGKGLFESDGSCVRAMGTAIDISARKRAEAQHIFMLELTDVLRRGDTDAALRQASALMGKHFGVSRVGYGHLDPVEDEFDYDICWTDGTVQPLLGRFPASAFGVKIVAKLNAGETVVVEDLFADALSDETETRATATEVDTRSILVVPFVRAGRLRTIVYLNDRPPRRWTSGEVAFMEEVAERTRQVIARGQAEAALHTLNATLEARVEERTAELRIAEAALRQSQKMEAVGQLTGGIAHDFNNLLTIIIGNLDTVDRQLRGEGEPKLRRAIENARKGADRAATLTQRLLAFSRRQPLAPRPTDVAALVRGMSDLLARSLGERITVHTPSMGGLWPALADPGELENALLNLAVNARDAMRGGGTLTIEASNVELELAEDSLAPGPYVRIAVADNGCGMTPEIMAQVFEPFFSTKEVGKGTGLGLSMVYGFVRQSGGDVKLVSTVDQGTTVQLYLPKADAVPHALALAADTSIGIAGPGETVLVVEDDPEVRAVSTQALRELGYEVLEAADGPAALTELSSRHIDLLFSDVVMPIMSGQALAEAATALQPGIQILLTSGYTREELPERARSTLLAKPFTFEQLASAVRRAIDGE